MRPILSSVGQVGAHRDRAVALVHPGEAIALVEPDRGTVLRDAERDRLGALTSRLVEERPHPPPADAVATPARDNRDRKLRRRLVDEAVAAAVLLEEPVPGGANREPAVECDHGCVAGPPPVLDVVHRVHAALELLRRAPVVRVAEHVSQEAGVLRRARPNHPARSSSTSWRRLPSGSKTSSPRTSLCSSSTVPTFTASPRRRSASALTSSTSIAATPPSSCGSPSAIAILISPRSSFAQPPSSSTKVSVKPMVSV